MLPSYGTFHSADRYLGERQTEIYLPEIRMGE